MPRRAIALFASVATLAGGPAQAQFGSMLRGLRQQPSQSSPPPARSTTPASCDASKPPSRGKALLGKIMNRVADDTVGRSVLSRYVPIPEVAGILTDAIACRLDSAEQQQAAQATSIATREGELGSSASWTSGTRADVSGSSTVVARQAEADGSTCITVNDVVIVSGEETTVPKRMCRAPGATGFTIAA